MRNFSSRSEIYFTHSLRSLMKYFLTLKEKFPISAQPCNMARFCCNNYQPTASVTAMIQDLGWKTLESRRTMTRLTLLYKMSRGEIDIDTNSFLRPHAESRTRASHSYRYRQDKATKNLYFYFFFREL